MANLVIKPASGSTNKLVFQNQAGNVDAITVEDSGNVALSTIASGTIASTTTFPAGHILLVKQYVHPDTESTTSTNYVDIPSFQNTITPSSTSNKILVMVQMWVTNEGGYTWTQLHRTGGASSNGAIYVGSPFSGASQVTTTSKMSGGDHSADLAVTYLDSPGVASAVVYKLQWRNRDGNGTSRFNINNDGTTSSSSKPSFHSSITLMEVQG